jgi:hypothetical protein
VNSSFFLLALRTATNVFRKTLIDVPQNLPRLQVDYVLAIPITIPVDNAPDFNIPAAVPPLINPLHSFD